MATRNEKRAAARAAKSKVPTMKQIAVTEAAWDTLCQEPEMLGLSLMDAAEAQKLMNLWCAGYLQALQDHGLHEGSDDDAADTGGETSG